MRTEKDNIKRNLIVFVYKLYRNNEFHRDAMLIGYDNPLACNIDEAFSAYKNDNLFRAIYDMLEDSFYNLFKIDMTK